MKHNALILVLALSIAAIVAAPAANAGDADRNYGFKFSGFFKTDISYDNAQIYPGDYHLWVPQYTEEDNALYFTARETRLGFDFFWQEEKVKTSAKLEFDFYGAGASAVNKASPMLRHAYVKLQGEKWSVIAGQTWDVISPLNPKTVNYSVAWCQGNIGYRRPQLRFTTWTGVGERGSVKLDVALARNMGGDLDLLDKGSKYVYGDGTDDGADAGTPVVEGRLGLSSGFAEEGNLSIGVSGHYGREQYNVFSVSGKDSLDFTLDSWSFNADMALKLNSKVTLMGEFFVGENLQTYLGGISQKVDQLNRALPTMGGWGMLSVTPTRRLALNAGYAFDDPDEDEYSVTSYETFRDENSLAFGNIMYDITSNVTGMVEVSYLKTAYTTKTKTGTTTSMSTEEYDDVRIQFALKAAIK